MYNDFCDDNQSNYYVRSDKPKKWIALEHQLAANQCDPWNHIMYGSKIERRIPWDIAVLIVVSMDAVEQRQYTHM